MEVEFLEWIGNEGYEFFDDDGIPLWGRFEDKELKHLYSPKQLFELFKLQKETKN